ncbi:SufE family protein [Pikeienuella piscinae]|uniref:SufE family protein n=1 Tax=Pikeienuella piscinae TaxID=2748098 RepID=A0A7L5BUZ3_9RHOB|nr:SufE family protein [Pikeienuella piscinae]QIE54588.1 SufE family protein [Pikeienuella piscinae]
MDAENFDEVVETFELLDDWEDRYRYVIDLGRGMPPMAESQKSALTKVDGCASQVWIAPRIEGEGAARRLHFVGDSDAMIVRGLIAVLWLMLSGRSPAEIREEDIEGRLKALGLDQHLSSQRSNGLRAMVARLKDLARAAA